MTNEEEEIFIRTDVGQTTESQIKDESNVNYFSTNEKLPIAPVLKTISFNGKPELTEEQFLNDPENKEGALALASAFEQLVGHKWFNVEKLCKKSGMDRQQAFQKLQMCKIFGTIAAKLGNWRDDKKDLREPLFKVTISNQAKIEALDGIIQYHKDCVSDAEMKKKVIEMEYNRFSSSEKQGQNLVYLTQ